MIEKHLQSKQTTDRKVSSNVQIPVAALKRFANDLEYNHDDNVNSNKFLQINRERVQEFISKSSVNTNISTNNGLRDNNQKQKLSSSSNMNMKFIPGINLYPDIQSPVTAKPLLSLQTLPEFNNSLG